MPTVKRCSCGALIKFVKTAAGHWQPQELDGTPHHAKCTNVQDFRRAVCSGSGDNATHTLANAMGRCPACAEYWPLQKRDATRVARHPAAPQGPRQPETVH